MPVVEDAAHAFPSPIQTFGGRFAGTIGRAGAFSFYATKTITTGEGGMLVTDDAALADRARTMRLHGIGRDAWKRYTAAGSWYYEIEAAGFKDNLTDLAAAIGLVQLERAAGAARGAGGDRTPLPRTAWRRSATRDASRSRRVPTIPATPGTCSSSASAPKGAPRLGGPRSARCRGSTGSLRPLASRRARAIDALTAAGIGVSVHFIPLHLHPLYRRMGYRPGQFPNARERHTPARSASRSGRA